ncbi:MAG: hypothetical protein HUU47_11240, partial [Bacteroidetes bacterium]|nr:hypothetical protein [Bacteroidota bacterium]
MLKYLINFIFLFTIQFSRATLNEKYLPIDIFSKSFIKNVGQWDNNVIYRVYRDEFVVNFLKNKVSFSIINKHNFISSSNINNEILVWEINFQNMNSCIPESKEKINSTMRFFGNGSPKGKLIELSNQIIYKNIYNNIDLIFYIDKNLGLKWDFVLNPGAEIHDIKLNYKGIESLKINEKNELIIKTSWNTYKEKIPISFLMVSNKINDLIDVNYKIDIENNLTFKLSKTYDNTKTLIIDPVLLEWSTYFYGTTRFTINNFNHLTQIIGGTDIDSKGFIYVCGTTNQDFPLIPGLHNSKPSNLPQSNTDVYYCKLTPDCDSFVFFNFIGGSNKDIANSLNINSKNECVITGVGAYGYPFTKGTIDTTYGDFITVFNKFGDSLIFSTFFNNTSKTIANITETGDVIVAGTCSGSIKTTSSALQTSFQGGWSDGFVAKIKYDGKSILFSTYIGGSNNDEVFGLCVNNNEDIFLVGYSNSNNFPINTTNSNFKSINGLSDGFLLKLDKNGSKLHFSNYIGGKENDYIQSIYLNSKEEIFISGYTNSSNFPVTTYPSPFQAKLSGKYDLFVMKFLANGSNFKYSTYLGGSNDENSVNWINGIITQIYANVKDEAYIIGITQSTDFPITKDAFQNSNKAKAQSPFYPSNLTLSKLSVNGDKLLYSTYLGGSFSETILTSRIKKIGCVTNLIIGGVTMSRDYPTTKYSLFPNAPDDTLFGNGKYSYYNYTSFISKFNDTLFLEKTSFKNKTKTYCNKFLEILDGLNIGAWKRWNNGDSSRYFMVENKGMYWYKASYGCDTLFDTFYAINPIINSAFSASDTALCQRGNSFVFADKSSFVNDVYSKSVWTIGDSIISSDSVISWSFASAGVHSVKLKTISKLGCTDTFVRNIQVFTQNNIGFSVNDSVQCLNNNSFSFVNTSADTTLC